MYKKHLDNVKECDFDRNCIETADYKDYFGNNAIGVANYNRSLIFSNGVFLNFNITSITFLK